MRIVEEINHETCKITIFSWNQKYLVKYERNGFEQTFKISELDVVSELEVKEAATNSDFIKKVMERFRDMQAEWKSLFDYNL